jgi:signal transduction histidine kinase/CheY-like chemotaxis protein/HPt (histidine-containing phosphotransfer) domain-containing protein
MARQYIRPLIFALCLLWPHVGHTQTTALTDGLAQKGAIPLQLPSFEDKTYSASARQAQAQFMRFGGQKDIFAVSNLLALGPQGAMTWLELAVTNNSNSDKFFVALQPQGMSGVSPIKSLRVYDPMQPEAILAAWPENANASLGTTVPVNLPRGGTSTRYILVETWPGLKANILPLLKSDTVMMAEKDTHTQKLSLLLVVIGFMCGAGLIQLILTKQPLQIGLVLNALLIGGGLFVLNHPHLLARFTFAHGVMAPLLFSAALGIGASLMQMLAGKSLKADQTAALSVAALNIVAIGLGMAMLPQLVSMGLPLHYLPHIVQTLSGLILLVLTLIASLRLMAFAWFLPAWLMLALAAWLSNAYPFAPYIAYGLLLLAASVSAVFAYWQNMARETVALQRRLKQDLKYSKERGETEGRDWQQKLDSERVLLNELKAREQQRAAELDIARREAESANKAKSDFLAIISHEIRTPMNGIMGIVQLMHQTPMNEKQLEYVDVIKNSGDTMLTLLNDILDYSKIEKGAIDIENIPLTLRSLIQSVATLMSGRAKDKGLDIIIEVDEAIPDHLVGDPNRLRQILLNLVSNAIKFTESGSVTIKVAQKKADKKTIGLHFSVIDTGMGIAPEVQSKLFQAYVQADASISRRFGGTGLGLNICRMLVAAMDGEIGLTSELNHGSTFWFDLTFEVAPDDIAIKTVSVESYQPSRLLNVLVIDDNDINLKVVRGLLEIDGHSITTTTKAEQGLKMIYDKIFDLVFVDLLMPGMDGKSFAMKVRQHPNQFIARTPIYALTGMGGDVGRQAAQSSGMQGVLTKPVTQQGLRAIIESVSKSLTSKDKDPDMAMKDLINKLGALAPIDREKLAQILKEGTQGVKELYEAVRHEVKLNMNAETLPPEEAPLEAAPEQPKSNVVPYLNLSALNDLKNSLPAPTLQSLFSELVTKAQELTVQMEEATALKDVDDLGEKAHNLKGMAGNFGLEALSHLCGKIEHLARGKDSVRAFDLVPKAKPLLVRTLTELENWSKS